ncbi:MAG: tRNA 4-thiouridine(8) synthase ThiI [SAR202 cluster bacterium Io17-Chloro-G4]|nr:MAG: tRNA 4-thiouridine(8) synthase ThiI [SAR202 cluster bacterium Io17-Chloro-G4]
MKAKMKTHVIVKTHELALKGKNRPWFMRHLVNNLRKATAGTGVSKVWQGHMLVGLSLDDESVWPAVSDRVRECFGVAKFFKAYEVPVDLDIVKEVLPGFLGDRNFQSFRISANRADKRFPVTSEEINRDLGTFVKDLTGARVDLSNPDLEVFLDVLSSGILLYFEEVRGHGGLPVGVSGDVMTMLSGGIDSPVAAWQMMKRGCRARFTHFHSYPLVDRSSIEKAVELASHLNQHQFASSLSLVPLSDIQKQIIVSTPPAYRVILYRRFMVRITEILARLQGAKAIVTGESCGQVSSQTLENIAVIDAVADMPILRPLIGLNKEEIVQMSRGMGTFAISIQPDQDCCSLFVPKHPETHARLETVVKLEAGLAVDELVEAAVANTEVREVATSRSGAYSGASVS